MIVDKKLSSFNCTMRLLRKPFRHKLNGSCASRYCSRSTDVKRVSSNHGVPREASLMENIDLERTKGSVLRSTSHVTASSRRMDSMNSSRVNELNIQMLSRHLHEQIFRYGESPDNDCGRGTDSEITNREESVEQAKRELVKLGLWSDEVKYLPDVALKLPKLKGNNILEHFWLIGEEQCQPYRQLLNTFIKKGMPVAPKNWLRQRGWTRYKAGEDPVRVEFPDEEALVLDVEVTLEAGEGPTLAVAVSSDAWYGWVSPVLTEDVDPVLPKHYTTDMLIPLEDVERDERFRIVVGHNISYDRARIKEQYYLEGSRLRFMDTMSLHNCIGGMCRAQKSLMKSGTQDADHKIWKATSTSCLTSLKDIYALYCKSELSKEEKNVFIEGSLKDVRDNFGALMDYCSRDVKSTYEVLQVLFPLFIERFPHPVTLAGMLELGMAYLTVNSNWEKYLKACYELYEDTENEMKFLLARKCDIACELMHYERYKKDMWMWSEDWSTSDFKFTKRMKEVKPKAEERELEEKKEFRDEELDRLNGKFKHLFEMERFFPAVLPLLPGYPAWYRKLCSKPTSPDWKPGPQALTSSMIVTPKLLNLKYEGYPLHHIRNFGWGILVADLKADVKNTSLPIEELKEITRENQEHTKLARKSSLDSGSLTNSSVKQSEKMNYSGSAVWCEKKLDNCCYFLKLPHKDGENRNVGNPLSKSFNSVISSDKLTGHDAISELALSLTGRLSYWRNNRERITSQMVVWLKESELNKRTGIDSEVGVILPRIIVCGTLTRRAVEPTWLTASKANRERLGSELRAMIQAPPGYHFVGADVDSQELWIASLIGDSNSSKMHGGTPLGWMTLSGTKTKGTDLHSITAKAAGISRDHAKVINYSRIYGAGVQFAQRLLQQYNPKMTVSEAKSKAQKMYALTKGRNVFKMREEFTKQCPVSDNSDLKFTDLSSALSFAKKHGKTVEEVFHNRKWEGGIESAMFNELEKIAGSLGPRTPFLDCRLSRAIEPRFPGDDQYMSTRINWVVQSGGVDFLHLMLVCMRWLTDGRARFSLSFHDEVRYLVPSEDRYRAALALHVTNLLTRSFFAKKMGLDDLPLSVAFFSSVDVDKSLRKEADDDCVTPSNPNGLRIGYGVPHGECLNIYDTLEKSGGDLSSFRQES